jgi:hypothetical protein
MSSSEYLRSNPLAEHNSSIALSSKEVPITGGSSGNMYPGQGGRAFVQGGGGMSQYHSFDGGNADSMYARGSYAPVTVGHNSVTSGGSRRRGRGRGRSRGRSRRKLMRPGKKCSCILFGGSRRYRRSRKCHVKNCHCICHSRSRSRSRSGTRRVKQRGGSSGFANAAYSIAGPGTGIDKYSSALANPAPHSAYNSCHPVA